MPMPRELQPATKKNEDDSGITAAANHGSVEPSIESQEGSLKLASEIGSVVPSYQLKAFITHVGESARRGHYVGYHKNFKGKRWVRHDDEFITELPGDRLPPELHTDGYILLYESRGAAEEDKVPSSVEAR